MPVLPYADHGPSRRFERSDRCVKLFEIDATIGEKSRDPDENLMIMNTGNHALSGQCLERFHFRRRDAAFESRLNYCLGERVFGGGLSRRCQGEKLLLAAAKRFDLAH